MVHITTQAGGQGLFMALNFCLLWSICYILHSDWSWLLLVNTHGSFHCKHGMLLENMQSSLYCTGPQQAVSRWYGLSVCIGRSGGMLPQENFVKLDTRRLLLRPQISYVPQFFANRISIVATYTLCELVIADCTSLVPRPQKRAWYLLFAHAQTPHFFCGASETTVIQSVFHDHTLLKHAGRYIVVENNGSEFPGIVFGQAVSYTLSKVGKPEIVLYNEL